MSNEISSIEILEIRGDILRIEGRINSDDYSYRDIYAVINDSELLKASEIDHLNVKNYSFEFPVKGTKNIRLFLKKSEGNLIQLRPKLGKFAKLQYRKKGSYYRHNKRIVRISNDGALRLINGTTINALKCELKYVIGTILKEREWSIAVYRIYAFIKKSNKKKQIWIISDRDNVAGDNGEAFFKYVSKANVKDIDIYFAIDRHSSDYVRMKKYGKVLALNSYKHKKLFLCADKIISSHADEWVINCFADKKKYVRSMYDFDFIFLQHGIIGNDMSDWLNRFNKNIKTFFTSAKGEQKSILTYNYGYGTDIVKLTGLARYDYLIDKKEKLVIFCPTWRKNIAGEIVSGTSRRKYNDNFKKSDYYIFFNELINNEELKDVLQSNGFTGEFYLHPAIFEQALDFKGNETIRVMPEIANYNDILARAAIMVTDLSSVAFDFAYLRKPIVYSQFDFDTYYDSHFYEPGYFNYYRDGFGAICSDINSTVNEIAGIIKNKCESDEQYIKRIDAFFEYNDRNNCERIYEEIRKLDA